MTSAQRHTWWLWDKFKSADKDGNGELEAKEVKKFFLQFHIRALDLKIGKAGQTLLIQALSLLRHNPISALSPLIVKLMMIIIMMH